MLSKKMKAAIYRGERSIGLEEVDVPSPEPGYVLLEMRNCGICGSDLHSYLGHWGQSSNASGHEVSGVVAECGGGVTNVHVGDRVCVECFSHCGECRFCKVGDYNLCENLRGASGGGHSGFAEYVIAHSSSLFHFPEDLSFEDGAMIEPLAVSYRAFRRTEADYQDAVLVIGSGTIGLLAVAAAKVSGVRRAMACARYDHQADMAKELGAHNVIRVRDQNVKEEVLKVTDGLGADAVIETTASAGGFSDALSAVRKRGSIVLVGGYHKPLEVHLSRIVGSEIRVTGSSCYGYSGMRKDFEWSMDLISSGKIPVSKLITHRFPLDDVQRAFETAADKKTGSIKVQVYNDTAPRAQ
jgi:2-desacetyl-2-hydroxyethyl bacteriochlorophyllide A dehydrogenase